MWFESRRRKGPGMMLPGPSVLVAFWLRFGLETTVHEPNRVGCVEGRCFADDLGYEVVASSNNPNVASLIDSSESVIV